MPCLQNDLMHIEFPISVSDPDFNKERNSSRTRRTSFYFFRGGGGGCWSLCL
jgi:hypothetical protein